MKTWPLDSLRLIGRLLIIAGLISVLLIAACKKEEADTELPVVTIQSPLNCDSIKQGNFIQLEAALTDNRELHKWAVDIHQNFDHTSYAPTDQGCNFGPDKTPFNPFKYAVVEEIQPGTKDFTLKLSVLVPEGTDDGDYFLVVYAQDTRGLTGWYSISLSIYNDDVH